jgi:hypothetical protein
MVATWLKVAQPPDGRRFHIYASKTAAKKAVWSRDLAVPTPGEALPSWMIELAEQVGMIEPGALALLPRGVIVGSAVIEKVSRVDSMYRWHLADVERAADLRKPTGSSPAGVVSAVLRAAQEIMPQDSPARPRTPGSDRVWREGHIHTGRKGRRPPPCMTDDDE